DRDARRHGEAAGQERGQAEIHRQRVGQRRQHTDQKPGERKGTGSRGKPAPSGPDAGRQAGQEAERRHRVAPPAAERHDSRSFPWHRAAAYRTVPGRPPPAARPRPETLALTDKPIASFAEIRAVMGELPGPDLEAGSAAAAREATLTKPAG